MKRRPKRGFVTFVVPARLVRGPAIRRAAALLREKGYAVTIVPLDWDRVDARATRIVAFSHDYRRPVPVGTEHEEVAA